jgi:hypothetical protein
MHGEDNVKKNLVTTFRSLLKGTKIILKCNLRVKIWECLEWIISAQDRDSLRAVVSKLMNFRVSQSARNL